MTWLIRKAVNLFVSCRGVLNLFLFALGVFLFCVCLCLVLSRSVPLLDRDVAVWCCSIGEVVDLFVR